MASYSVSVLADQDLEAISYYTTLNFGERKTLAYKSAIIQSSELVANFPSMGKLYTTKQGRIFQKYNIGEHALFYQPTEAGIFVVPVLHLMMGFDRHLDSSGQDPLAP